MGGIDTTISFARKKSQEKEATGLISEFGYLHEKTEAGFQAGEYEQRLVERFMEEKRQRVRSWSAAREALKRGASTAVPVRRHEIIQRDESTCYLCGKVCSEHEIHLDHVVPLSKGGTHTPDNLRVACAGCNLSKGSKLVAA